MDRPLPPRLSPTALQVPRTVALGDLDGSPEVDPPTPLTRESLASQAYLCIRRGLMNGRYRPGQKLTLRTLTAELGISPTPIREALARLVSEQALAQPDRRSVRVPEIDLARWRDVRDLRLELEGMAAHRAASRATEAGIAHLERLHDQMMAAKDARDLRRILKFNERFHLELCALAGMPALLHIVEGLWLQCGPLLQAMKYSPVIEPQAHPHLDVLRALRVGDAERARAGIRADILSLDEHMIERLLAGLSGTADSPQEEQT